MENEPAPQQQDAAKTIYTGDPDGLFQSGPCVQFGGMPLHARAFLDTLVRLKLLTPHDLAAFLVEHAGRLAEYANPEKLGAVLIEDGLLTEYQFDRIMSETGHGLVIGNHKVLRKIGAGGMGEVFLAEHIYLRRREALKILPVDDDCRPELLTRFYSEMQVLAELRHPNIVMAYDAGQEASRGPAMPSLLYLAMEFVDGSDLEKHVVEHGPVPIEQACHWIGQAALALQDAHDRTLIHRDIKPSNLLLTREGNVKIVDFGLVQQFSKRLTQRGLLLGTIDYMPPEQSCDAAAVTTAADIYGLGATLFWLLTGEPPYPRTQKLSQTLEFLRRNNPRPLRSLRPDAPPELEALLQSLLHRDPTCRPALPLTVSRALTAFNPTAAKAK
jgi:serine/threonine protein kinase